MTIEWDDEFVVLPDTTTDEDAVGNGSVEPDDERLTGERPPHWEPL